MTTGSSDPFGEPVVVAVVPTLEGGARLVACLDALGRQTTPVAVVVVADGPEASSRAGRVAAGRTGLHLVPRPRRTGYAPATAAGVERALLLGARWVLLLNDDCRLAPDAVARLLDVGADPNVGVVGPLVVADDGAALESAGLDVNRLGSGRDRLRGARPDLAPAAPCDPVAVTGAALLVRDVALRAAGGLDPSWRFYFEDVDLCLSVRDAGFRIRLAPAARAVHSRSATLGRGSARQAYWLATNQVRLVARRWGAPALFSALPLALGRAALRPVEAVLRGELAVAAAEAAALVSACVRTPFDLARRRPVRDATARKLSPAWTWSPVLSGSP
jgi:GT2 family glycosyltransferase